MNQQQAVILSFRINCYILFVFIISLSWFFSKSQTTTLISNLSTFQYCISISAQNLKQTQTYSSSMNTPGPGHYDISRDIIDEKLYWDGQLYRSYRWKNVYNERDNPGPGQYNHFSTNKTHGRSALILPRRRQQEPTNIPQTVSLETSAKDLKKYLSYILYKIKRNQLQTVRERFDSYYNIKSQQLLLKFQSDYKYYIFNYKQMGPLPDFQLLEQYPQPRRMFLLSSVYSDQVQKARVNQAFIQSLLINDQTQQQDNEKQREISQAYVMTLKLLLFKEQQNLIKLKYSVYRQIGLHEQAEQLKNYLPDSSSKSSVLQLDQENHDILLYQSFIYKKNKDHEGALKTLERAITLSQNPSDKSEAYLTKARYMKQFGLELNQVMQNYHQALNFAQYDKTQIIIEIQAALKYYSGLEGLEALNSMTRYFDERLLQIQYHRSNKGFMSAAQSEELTELLIQKAEYLKLKNCIPLAKKSFALAVSANNHKTEFQRGLLIRKQAHFLLELRDEKESIQTFRLSYKLHQSHEDLARFVEKIQSMRSMSSEQKSKLVCYLMDYYKGIPEYYRFKSRDNNQKIAFFENCLQNLEENGLKDQRGFIHRQLAQCYKELQGNYQKQVIENYDQAFKFSFGHAKTSIYYEKKYTFKEFIKTNPRYEYHIPLISYLNQQIQNEKTQILQNKNHNSKFLKHNLIQKLIEKAELVMQLGSINQAIDCFQQSIEIIQPKEVYQKFQLYSLFINFLLNHNIFGPIFDCWNQIKCGPLKRIFTYAKRLNDRLIQNTINQHDQLGTIKIINDYMTPPWDTQRHPLQDKLTFCIKTQNTTQIISTLRQIINSIQMNLKKSLEEPRQIGWKQIYQTQKHSLYTYYIRLVKFLEINDQQDLQILITLRKAFDLYNYASIELYGKITMTISNIIQTQKSQAKYLRLMAYFDKLLISPKNDSIQILQTKINCSLMMEDFCSAETNYEIMISKMNKANSTWYTKSKIFIKLAFLCKNNGNFNRAIDFVNKSINLWEGNIKWKYRLLWQMDRHNQANQLIQNSKNKKSLMTEKGKILKQKAKEFIYSQNKAREQQQIQKNRIIEDAKEAFLETILLCNDYHTIQNILQEHKQCLKMQSFNKQIMEDKKNQILDKMNIRESFSYINKNISFGMASFDTKNHLSWKKKFIQNWVNEKKQFSIQQLFKSLQSNQKMFALNFIEQIMHQILQKYWSQKRFKEAFNVFRGLIFISKQNSFISQYHEHYLLRQCFSILQHYQQGDYESAFKALSKFKQNKSRQVQLLVSGSLYKASNLALIMQKINILCIWHMGNYQQASRLLAELIFTTGNFVEFINARRFKTKIKDDSQYDVLEKLQNPQTYTALVKYNSLMYSRKKGDKKESIRKSQDLEYYLKNHIRDIFFHINYALDYFNVADSLYMVGDIAYVDPYCMFMKRYNQLWNDFPQKRNQIADLTLKHRRAQQILKNLFQQTMKEIEQSITRFRDLCYQSEDRELNFEIMKKLMTRVDENFMICIKISNHKVISQTDKEKTNAKYWKNICKVIYQDILKRNVEDCYADMETSIEQVRRQLKQRTVITRTSLNKQIILPERAYYESQIDAIIDDKIVRSQKGLEQAKLHIQALIEKTQIQEDENQNIYDRINDVQEKITQIHSINTDDLIQTLVNQSLIKIQNNPFIADILNNLKQTLQSKVTYHDLENKLNQVYQDIREEIRTRPNESIEKIRQEFQRIQQKIQGFKNLPCEHLDKESIIQNLKNQHQGTDDGKRFIAMMQQVLSNAQNKQKNYDIIQAKLIDLQAKIQNRVNLFDLNDNLVEFSQIFDWKTVVEQQNNIKRLIKETSRKNNFQVIKVREQLQEAIDRNFQYFQRRFDEQIFDEKKSVDDLKNLMRRMNNQISIIDKKCSIIKQLQDKVKSQQNEMVSLLQKMSRIDYKHGNTDASQYVEMKKRIKGKQHLVRNGLHTVENFTIKQTHVQPRESYVRNIVQASSSLLLRPKIDPKIKQRRYMGKEQKPNKVIEDKLDPEKISDQDKNESLLSSRFIETPNSKRFIETSNSKINGSPGVRPSSSIRVRPTSSRIKTPLQKKNTEQNFDDFAENDKNLTAEGANKKSSRNASFKRRKLADFKDFKD